MSELSFAVDDGQAGAPVVAQVKDSNGAPALFIDGKPRFTMVMMAPWHQHEATTQGQVKLRAEKEAGIDLHSTCDELSLRDFNQFWHGPGQYDYSLIDEKLKAVAANNPQACIFIKLYVQAPKWWVEAHPSEWVKYANGHEPDRSKGLDAGNSSQEATLISYASVAWREDAKAMVRAFIHHLESVPWGRRVIAINLLNGHCQEWHYWGSIFGYHPDVSAPMTQAFRQWLRAKYGADVKRLRAAWADDGVTFETAEAPGLAPRLNTTHLYFRDPAREQAVIDYYRCQHELTADVLLDFCHTVKEASGGRLLAGAYYGYLFHSPWYPDGLSLGMEKVLASPDVDFLAAPSNYNDWLSRGLGGDALLRSLPEAIKAAGKLHISESDEGTYQADRVHRPCEAMNSWDESVANMRKQWAQVLTRGVGHWWWDWEDNGGLYVHPEHVAALHEMKRIGDLSVRLDRRSNAEVALVYDLQSFYYTKTMIGNPTWELLDVPTHVAARSGFPFDIITLHDLERADLPAYKLYVFPNAFYVEKAMRERIRQVLARNHATALWVYAPGYVDEAGLSLDAMRELTGFRFGEIAKEIQPRVRLTATTHPLTRDFGSTGTIMRIAIGRGNDNKAIRCEKANEFEYGQGDGTLGPVFTVDDPEATVLGELAEVGKPGLAVKESGGFTSIYSAAVPSSTELMRRIARGAGVHLFNERDDVMMIGRHFITMPTRLAAGETEIHLPEPADVYDCFARQWVGEHTDRFTVKLPAGATQVFYYGSRADWAQAAQAAGVNE